MAPSVFQTYRYTPDYDGSSITEYGHRSAGIFDGGEASIAQWCSKHGVECDSNPICRALSLDLDLMPQNCIVNQTHLKVHLHSGTSPSTSANILMIKDSESSESDSPTPFK